MISWRLKAFEELSLAELYAVLQLRAAVFVVEQNCPYLDADGKDAKSWHLMAWKEDRLLAYTRLLPAGVSFTEASIGRVATAAEARGQGLGKLLMAKSIESLYQLFGKAPIRIGAQRYLKKFYEDFGFVQEGEKYLEDNIEHIEMLKT